MARPATDLEKDEAAAAAADLWQQMDKNERTGVRFGMFPAARIRKAEELGIHGHELCVQLMACASKDGGMRA